MNFIRRIYIFVRTHPKFSVFVVFLAVLFFISIFSTSNKTLGPTLSTPTPTPTGLTSLNAPTIYPASGNLQAGGTKVGISVFFEAPVDVNTVTVTSEPTLGFKVGVLGDDLNRVIITPLNNWVTGTRYKIKISRGVITRDGKKVLNQDINIEYSIKEVPTPTSFE